ncbi:MAG TPA: hypothetical protein PLB89_10785 [Flavobacteriales bacterium]|nr:hypothetical protein [Flavobacteriales bacterium]
MNTSALVPLALFFALLAPNSILAQEKKPQMVIAVEPVTAPNTQPENVAVAQQLTDLITRVLQRTKQFQVVSNVHADATKQERERQKTSDYAGGKTADQYVVDGADKLLIGKLTSVQAKQQDEPYKNLITGETKTVNYTYIQVLFTLELLDVAHNTSISAENFKVPIKSNSPGGAYDELMKQCGRRVSNWMVKNLDHDFRIVQVETRNKKGYPKTVLINGGTNMDLQTNEQLQVVEIQRIGESIREIPVCMLSVSQVQGEFSVCNVVSLFGSDIEKLHQRLEAKAELKVWFKTEAQ